MHRFNLAELHASPWKNGGGVTREIVSIPRGSSVGTFDWRVSVADVSSDGPFSIFDGVERVIVLLEGNGLVLRGADGESVHRLDEVFEPFEFSGDDQITSSLIAGPSTDFNVMTRQGVAHADVRVIRARHELGATDAGLLLAVKGEWLAHADIVGEQRLSAGHGAWWDSESVAWSLSPPSSDAVLLAVSVERE